VAGFQTGRPTHFLATVSPNSLMPKKTSLPKARDSLNPTSAGDMKNEKVSFFLPPDVRYWFAIDGNLA